MKKIFVVIFLLMSSEALQAQTISKQDSLLKVILQSKEDTVKVAQLIKYSSLLERTDSAKKYADQALELARKLNWEYGIANAYHMLGIQCDKEGNYPCAVLNNNEAIAIRIKIKDRKGLERSYNNLGITFKNMAKYSDALEAYGKCEELMIESKNNAGLSGLYGNIGTVYENTDNYAKAIENHFKALSIAEKIADSSAIATSCMNIANIYFTLNDFDKSFYFHERCLAIRLAENNPRKLSQAYANLGNLFNGMQKYKQSLDMFYKAIELKKTIKDKRGLGMCYNGLGELFLLTNNNDSALSYLTKGLAIRKEIVDNLGIATTLANIGTVFYKKSDYKSAEPFLKEAIDTATKYAVIQVLRDANLYLALINEHNGNQNSAISYYKNYYLFKDSISNDDRKREFFKKEIQYDYDKKAAEIKFRQQLAEEQVKQITLESRAKEQLLTIQRKELELSNNEKKLQQLQLQKSSAELSIQITEKEKLQAETQVKESQVKLLSKEKLLQENEIEKQKFISSIVGFGIIAIIAIGLLVFNRFSLQKKIERQQALIAERVRISRELHDDVGAQLSTAKLFLNDLRKNFNNEKGKDLLDNSLGLLETSIKDLRVVMDDLRQSTLKDHGYIAAAEELVNTINQRHGINFNMSHHGIADRLPQITEHNLFRITQELINNTLKYADAKKVTIDLVRQTDKIVFTYEDDGKGFDQGKAVRGYGLANIESRIQSLDGHMEINSSPGNGFMAIIEIPLST